jgi:hypothetical protein
MKLALYALGLCSIGLVLQSAEPAPGGGAKLTGWFACEKCTAGRVAKGDIGPNNPDCAKQCIDKGSEAVFLSEQGRESLKVRNYPAVKEDLGYHLEVTGQIDEAAKTIKIESVKRLGDAGVSCSRAAHGTTK